ncbi:unnamed protein product [Somion occarium]|uniref:Uncharacterized protein n=1 Tax=Somion occarium TaxID=3059160 RepID=A0ABP1CUB1_9APHY
MYSQKRRRTATSVLAGDFDPRPSRDVLTSLLNGVPLYKVVEKEEEVRRAKKKEKKEKEKEKGKEREKEKAKEKERDISRARSTSRAREKAPAAAASISAAATSSSSFNNKRPVAAPRAITAASPFWQARPNIHIPHMQRSVSVTPPPMVSSPPTTPGPSISSTTSATSSKRPHTPYDDEDFAQGRSEGTYSPQPEQQRSRKKRPAARKGWKGWVEGSPPPSEKLINLDAVVVLGERKTRSGKSFDAIGVGKEGWV